MNHEPDMVEIYRAVAEHQADPQSYDLDAELTRFTTSLDAISSASAIQESKSQRSQDELQVPKVVVSGATACGLSIAGSASAASQLVLDHRASSEPRLSQAELRLLAQIASGVTADVAARKLELSARTLRRRLRAICDKLDVDTPIEAVVWASRRQLI